MSDIKDITFRYAQESDKEIIMQIIAQGQKFLAENGVDQWNNGYPEPERISLDISEHIGYVALDANNDICAYFAFGFYSEKDYIEISNGSFLTDTINDKYLTVHRSVVSDKMRNHGIAKKMLDFAFVKAKENGCVSVRIDTHNDNAPMRKVISSQGFTFCGNIMIDNILPRVAYEKLL